MNWKKAILFGITYALLILIAERILTLLKFYPANYLIFFSCVYFIIIVVGFIDFNIKYQLKFGFIKNFGFITLSSLLTAIFHNIYLCFVNPFNIEWFILGFIMLSIVYFIVSILTALLLSGIYNIFNK